MVALAVENMQAYEALTRFDDGTPPDARFAEAAAPTLLDLCLHTGVRVSARAELRTPNLPQLYLWEPDAYKDKINSITLYYGIVIGISDRKSVV